MTDVDPQFPRYRIETTIDGPRQTEGELVFQLHGRALVVPDDEKLAAGEPIQVFVHDFAGPRVERDPGEIPEPLLSAVAEALADAEMIADEPLDARGRAAVALREIGRRLHPSNSEAASLAIGVMKLDVEKLKKTGDEMADALRRVQLDGLEETLATWQGQAHRDWSHLHALRRST